MVPSAQGAPRKGSALNWLLFGVLGLAATAGGIFLPHSLRDGGFALAEAPTQTPSAPATESLDYTPPTAPDLPSPRAMFLRLGLGTAAVLILCVFTLYAGKRWIRPLAAPSGEAKYLRVLETLPLGGRCSVYLLQAGDTRILAGVDQTGLKSLLPLPPSFDGVLAEAAEPENGDDAEREHPKAA